MRATSINSFLDRSAPTVAFLILSMVALVFDIVQIPGTCHQFLAGFYPHVPGQITRSRVTGPHGKGGSYNADLAYTYVVDDIPFTGSRWQYSEGFGLSKSNAQARVVAHPLNAVVAVYYSPDDPASSILSPGLHTGDFLILLLLLPFNLILFRFVIAGILWFRNRFRHPATLVRLSPLRGLQIPGLSLTSRRLRGAVVFHCGARTRLRVQG
jgi:hypothetical protein